MRRIFICNYDRSFGELGGKNTLTNLHILSNRERCKSSSKMPCLFGALLSVLLSLSAGLSLDLLPGRHDISSSQPYSTNRLLHELQDQMQGGMGSNVNLPESQFSSKKKSSAFQASDYVPKSERKDDSFSSAGDSYSRSDESLGPAWDPLYSYPELHSFRSEIKRNKRGKKSGNSSENQELEEILKDDDSDKKSLHRERKIPPDVKRQDGHGKKKRQSDDAQTQKLNDNKKEERPNSDFQEWLRKEYYRNMAKSFASMRRKRAGWGPLESQGSDARSAVHHTVSSEKEEDRFEEVTSNLKSIENAYLSDALHVIKEHGEEYAEDPGNRNRITNDLNAAYDLETMRTALFRLRDTLNNMDDDTGSEEMIYENYRKRDDQCPPLDVLTSDCSALGDIVSEGPLKQVLLQACNWHEACYSCGKAFGLSSDNCDVGFVEQSRTICRGDVPCQSTANLLLLPLRQRRVFYKRSNPSVCFVDPCVEAFLKQG